MRRGWEIHFSDVVLFVLLLLLFFFFLTHTHKVFQTLSIRQHGAGFVIYVPSAAHQLRQGQLRKHACLCVWFFFFSWRKYAHIQNYDKNIVRVVLQYVFCFNEVPRA